MVLRINASPVYSRMRLLPLSAPVVGALLVLSAPLAAQKPAPRATKPVPKSATAPASAAQPPAPATTGYLLGVAFDSVHSEPLIGAVIQIEGAGRFAISDSLGRFVTDSVPPGSYRLVVDHPVLDTLGITLVTPPMTFSANAVTRASVTLPAGATLVNMLCSAARRTLGPGALVGRVREPDSDQAAVGARVSFVWYDPDPVGLPTALRPTRKSPRVREATIGADGTYRLCGLPEKYEGKLQAQRKDGGETAEVVVTQDDGLLALRSVSVAPLVVASQDSTGKRRLVAKGSARVTGRVVNKSGAPVANARIGLMGSSAATVTRANGEFTLDSLPAGTQALVVRQLGYRPTEVPVELSSRTAARVTVRLGEFVPELSPVEVVSRRDEGLQKVGYLDRKRSAASGYFLTPEQVESRHALQFTDLMRTIPGIQVSNQGGQAMLTSSRSSSSGSGGCVTVFVDGAAWQQLSPGDLDSFVRPEEVAAVEVYGGTQVPAQFTTPGQSCSAIVVWTKTRVLKRGK
jgi:hypothetical protein